MKRILYFIMILGLISCNNPFNDSILEPLSINELKKLNDKDSTFLNVYEGIQIVRDSILKTDVEKVKWMDLSYKRYFKFIKGKSDSSFLNPFNVKIYSEWNTKYAGYYNKADSCIQYWKDYLKENSPDSYVKIDLINIKKEYYKFVGGISNIYLGFKITPLKGTIEEIRFTYQLKPNPKEIINASSYFLLRSGSNYCWHFRPFSNSVIEYCLADYAYKDLFENNDLQTVLKDYNLITKVEKIQVKGKDITDSDLNIPASIKVYFDFGGSSLLPFIRTSIIKDLINKDYLDSLEYWSQEYRKALKEKDALSYEFYNLVLQVYDDYNLD